MRFKGTLVLFAICLGLGAFLYFYEIRGGEKREQAKQSENVVWKVPGDDIQLVELKTPEQTVSVSRTGDKQWKITNPRQLEADADEMGRIVSSAADISRTEVVEENAANLAPFGLNPPKVALSFKTKDGTVREIHFGENNPSGSYTYAALKGKSQVFFVSSYVASAFVKKLDDLRNHSIMNFDQFETQTLDLQNAKGKLQLAKENDRWWIEGKARWSADSSAVSTLLGDISGGRIKEFFDENPEDYTSLGFDKPLADVRLTVGKDKAIKHLVIGAEKSKLVKKGQPKAKPEAKKKDESAAPPVLYVAKDESRTELFFVEKEFADKLLKSAADLRDKALARFQRWDIDEIVLANAKGSISLTKPKDSSDWVVGAGKKKAKWDAASGIFDALEKPVKEFVDDPGPASTYGLDKPAAHVVLKQAGAVKFDCRLGKPAKDGIYAQVEGETFVKIAEKEVLDALGKGESDLVEPPPAAPAPAAAKK